jgi:hypothetical protein
MRRTALDLSKAALNEAKADVLVIIMLGFYHENPAPAAGISWLQSQGARFPQASALPGHEIMLRRQSCYLTGTLR